MNTSPEEKPIPSELTSEFKPASDAGETVEFPSQPDLADTKNVSPQELDGTEEFHFDPEATQLHQSTSVPSKASISRIVIPGYQILGELGRGAMGVVYKAKQERADRIVALKLMLNSDHAKSEDISRFKVEAQSAANLQHPNIVQVYDVGQVGDMPYFTLEYVDGGTLSRKISKQMLPPNDAAKMLLTLAVAIAYAHKRGVIHRDLKPANILVTPEGEPKIADFGLARRTDDISHLTIDGTVLGTPNYMSPEQASGDQANIGPLSDVYTLGAIFYELLVGRPPFKGSSAWDVIKQVRTAEPTPPSQLQPGIVRDLETICLKCLQKEPSKRYESAQHLADDLIRFLSHQPIHARPIGQWERIVRLCKRNPREARLVGAVVGLLTMIAIGATWAALEIAKQRDAIGVAKRLSQDRLKLYQSNVSNSVNRLPQLIEGLPFTDGLRKDIAKLTEEQLQLNDTDAPAVGPSKQWGLMAVELERGKIELNKAIALRANGNPEHEQMNAHAKKFFASALKIAEEVHRSGQGDVGKSLTNLAVCTSLLADAESSDKAEALYRKAIELREAACETSRKKETEKPLWRHQLALGREQRNFAEYKVRSDPKDPNHATHLKAGLELAKKAVDTLEQAIAEADPEDPETPNGIRDLSMACSTLGECARYLRDFESAKMAYEKGIEWNQKLIQLEPNRLKHVKDLIGKLNGYGDMLMVELKDYALARKQYGPALLRVREIRADPMLVQLENEGLAMGYYRLGLTSLGLKDPARAKNYFERCALIRELDLRQKQDIAAVKENPDLALRERADLMLVQARSGKIKPAIDEANSIIEKFATPERLSSNPISQVPFSAYALSIAAEQVVEPERGNLQRLALDVMRKCFQHNLLDKNFIAIDPDVEPLRLLPEFQAMMKEFGVP